MRARLFIASLAIVSAVIVLAGLFAHLELRRWLEARVEDELTHKLAVARVAVEMSASAPDDALADRLGDALDARVTIIDESGAVRGDSDVAAADLTALENHRARPEVAVALAAGHGDARGRDRRMSATVHKDMLYLAQKFTRADSAGVIRVATDYDVVDAAAARLRMLLALAGALGLAAAVGMSAFASTMLSRTLRTLVAHAQSLATEGSARFDVDGGDEITGVAGTLQRLADDLARTVLTLASERDRFAAVLEAMSEGVIGLDASGAVVLINAAARDLLQVGEGALDLARIAGLDDAATKARGGAVASAEIEVPVKRTVQVRAAPVRAGGAVLVLHDISEVRRLERVRRDFVGNVSHELRTPVSVIRASAETLLHSGVDDAARARGFLEAIDRNAERLTRLVGDLLDLSRIEAGQIAFAEDPLRLLDMCKRAVGAVDARARGHEIAVDVPPGLCALGDEKSLDQVLVNLLDNAVKYTPAGGHVTVRARESAPHEVLIEVEDDGPGIELKHRARVFERFYRVDPGRSRDVGGTGLGLAIVKHLVEGMGGKIAVAPAPARGSIFVVTLPGA